jgi:hypothetical protein
VSQAIHMDLWRFAQRVVYPKRWPSEGPPYPRTETGTTRKPASYLYYRLLDTRTENNVSGL